MKRSFLRSAAALALTFAVADMAGCQREQAPPPRVGVAVAAGQLPASLLKHLAEAADGYRTGQPVWVVADPNFPHFVAGVLPDSASAATLAGERGLQVYGSYITPTDFGLAEPHVMVGCYLNWTEWCGDIELPLPWSAVRDITVTITPTTGEPIVRSFKPDSIMAVFFNVSAVDRFVIPYFTRVYGSAYAKELRDSIEARLRRAAQR